MANHVHIIGAGLAGCEAAWLLAQAGVPVLLTDMKPDQFSQAHHDPHFGELVCSNSLRSADPASAVGLLKVEMGLMGSLVLDAARHTAVGAGKALAVDRAAFAAYLDQAMRSHPLIQVECRRVEDLPADGPTILASGPLTDGPLAQALETLAGQDHLHFYDAIAPVVSLDSVDPALSFWQDRYAPPGQGDYLNCPLSREEYQAFFDALMSAPQTPLREFEEPMFFEGCLPIEVMAGRGPQTLLFGPMKPVGLDDPRGSRPHAMVQLRKENQAGTSLNLVGFQTKLTRLAQDQVFRLIPALAQAEFLRYGSIHRNSFLDAPSVLNPDLSLKAAPHILVAGQLSGVEGYVESSASGILAGLNALRRWHDAPVLIPPPTTALGSLVTHLQTLVGKRFQPSNVNFGLFPPLEGKKIPKKQRGLAYAQRARNDLLGWMRSLGLKPQNPPPEI